MSARGAILTPFLSSNVELADDGTLRMWWKKLLPIGQISYKGRVLNFTRSYLDRLARAYNEGAYDQVPLQFADKDNNHTNDPERYRGEVAAMRVTGDGLYVGVLPTDQGEQVLQTNPLLGVSARIVEGYDRADGRFFPAAIQHVLATLDPRVPGLGAWHAIEASNDADVTYDLTGGTYTGDEKGAGLMPDLTEDQRAKLARLLDLPEDKFSALVAGTAVVPELTDEEIAALADEYDESEMSDDDLAVLIAGLSDAEIAQLEAEFQQDTAAAAAATGLSNAGAMALEMANYRTEQVSEQVAALIRKADRDAFELEKRHFINDVGLAPSILNFAQPLLMGSGHVVELSNADGQPVAVDAGQVMRKVLNEVGRIVTMLDLSTVELGSSFDAPEQHQQGAERRLELVRDFRSQTGL